MSKYKGKVILITGGTGSFGHSFLDYLKNTEFEEVRIFSRDELKQEQMRVNLANNKIKFYIGDVRNKASIDKAMRNVNYVFHAAALKQVPSCEFFPEEAILTNTLGSKNVMQSALENSVEKVVCLSTDKAVYPINSMGMTKALMEKIAQGFSRQLKNEDTKICTVRYGNIMCSRGSVIPLFINQIKQNKPVTVTEPKMTRFLLQLKDAVELVDYAFNYGGQGDILVKKSPACNMENLAYTMQEIFSSKSKITTIGMRHGEKLYETLVSREEMTRSIDKGDYYKIVMDDRDLNYNLYFTQGDANEVNQEDYTSHNTRQLNVAEIKDLLFKLPEIDAALEN